MKATTHKRAEISTQPATIKPMLATLVKEPFSDDNYVYEVKWDGYRIIAHCEKGKIKLQSREGQDFTKKYPSVARALATLNLDCIIDGEVVYINKEGKPDFDQLQKVNGQKAPIVYYTFDLLWLEGRDVTSLPLLERKEILRDVIHDGEVLKYSDHFEDGLILFETVRKAGMEGIIAKRKDSKYLQDDRSKKWLKFTVDKKQEFVLGGWVDSEKRSTFRSVLFGAYEGGKLVWKGHAGNGFKQREMPKILERLKAIEIPESPFVNEVDYSEGIPHFVKPELVANIKYATLTKSGRIRKPAIFLGFREDKPANKVVPEIPAEVKQVKKTSAVHTSSGSNWPELERIKITSHEKFDFGDCSIELHNFEKELWKGITKAKLIEYYNSVADYILPYLKNRPLSLHVKHRGPNAPGLYIKDMDGRQPECADIFEDQRRHKKPGKRDVIDYLVCNNKATLLYMIDLGCIDVNPWTSTVDNPLHPDFIIIDLDPSDEDFQKAVETARAAKQYFDEHKLKALIKTSGKTGIHLYVPCEGFTFPQARTIAERVCDKIHELVPEITTRETTVADRGTKLYVDANQNDYADTVAAPYSVRPFKHPSVSTPLEWKELKAGLNPSDFTIETIGKRLSKKPDLFVPVLDKGIAHKNSKILGGII
jgi:bifunctional non-homologous end joining protein LigD